MTEEKIVLDKHSFGALAVESRVTILKALKKRRKTLTELSEELNLSVSSTKEHLEKLLKAGLIVKLEDGHKWKYYELTKKGWQLVTPNTEIRVWVLLGTAIIAFIYSVMFMSTPSLQTTYPSAGETVPKVINEELQDPGVILPKVTTPQSETKPTEYSEVLTPHQNQTQYQVFIDTNITPNVAVNESTFNTSINLNESINITVSEPEKNESEINISMTSTKIVSEPKHEVKKTHDVTILPLVIAAISGLIILISAVYLLSKHLGH